MSVPRQWLGTAALLFIAALVLSACGAPSEADRRREARQREVAEAAAVADRCQSHLGRFLAALEDLHSRLEVGINYENYLSKVGDVRAAYDQIPFKGIDVRCLGRVGVPAEDALNDYADAGETWSNCIGDFNCSMDSIDPQLQSKWTSASAKVDRAGRGLAALRRP
jgi:hypothetical protein